MARAATVDSYGELIRRGRDRPGQEPVLSDLERRINMNGVNGFYIFEYALIDHQAGATRHAPPLRLEEDADAAIQTATVVAQQQRHPGGERRVSVVSAEVRHTRDLR